MLQGCVGRVRRAIEAVDGVVSAAVALDTETATVLLFEAPAAAAGHTAAGLPVVAVIEAVEATGKSAALRQA